MNDAGESPRQASPDVTDPYIALAYRANNRIAELVSMAARAIERAHYERCKDEAQKSAKRQADGGADMPSGCCDASGEGRGIAVEGVGAPTPAAGSAREAVTSSTAVNTEARRG